jgi:hypothetical protein
MDNKKIPTWLGTVIIIIFAATMGAFVWKYEKNQKTVEQSQNVIIESKPVEENKEQNNQQKDEIATPIDTSNWKTCKNITYNYEVRFPGDWKMTQHPIVKPIDSCNNVDHLYIEKDIYTNAAGFIVVDVFTKKQFQSTTSSSSAYLGVNNLDDYIKNNPVVFRKDILLKESFIQGERAIWTRTNTAKKEVITAVYLFHDGTLYSITSNDVDQKTFEVLLSTFKFIR